MQVGAAPHPLLIAGAAGKEYVRDQKGRSTLGFHNLHHKSTTMQNFAGFYLLDPPRGLLMTGAAGTEHIRVLVNSVNQCENSVLNFVLMKSLNFLFIPWWLENRVKIILYLVHDGCTPWLILVSGNFLPRRSNYQNMKVLGSTYYTNHGLRDLIP